MGTRMSATVALGNARTPRVTVLMGVHNGERFLAEALDSILAQTFRDFEVLIIDDASTDRTASILADYTSRHACIHLMRNTSNLGLTRTLNIGLAAARGEYIARMDADDTAFPERIARQVAFLDMHPEVGVLGTGAALMNADGTILRERHCATDHEAIAWRLFFTNDLIHTSVLFRSHIVGEPVRYDEAVRRAQDHALWLRLCRVTRLAVLPEVLVHYRIHTDNITTTDAGGVDASSAAQAARSAAEYLGRDVDIADMMVLRAPERCTQDPHPASRLRSAAGVLQDLHDAYVRTHHISGAAAPCIRRDMARRLLDLAWTACHVVPGTALWTALAAFRHDPSLLRFALWRWRHGEER